MFMVAIPFIGSVTNLPALILPSIIMGVIIGAIEMFFVYQDEMSMGILAITHALHTFPFTIIFVFLTMHVEIILNFIPMVPKTWLVVLIVRVVVGIVALIKIAGAAALVKGSMIGEKWIHSIIIAALIIAAPYIWNFVGPMVGLG
jgi:hypothetical protein